MQNTLTSREMPQPFVRNCLFETSCVSRYIATHISQKSFNCSDDNCSSHLMKLMYAIIIDRINQKPTDYEKIRNIVQTSFNENSNQLQELTEKYKQITSWDNIIELFTLLKIVSDLAAQGECKTEYINYIHELCLSQSITSWILIHGGWDAVKHYKPKSKMNYMYYILPISGLLTVVCALLYVTKKPNTK
jgi:hypothetical protein